MLPAHVKLYNRVVWVQFTCKQGGSVKRNPSADFCIKSPVIFHSKNWKIFRILTHDSNRLWTIEELVIFHGNQCICFGNKCASDKFNSKSHISCQRKSEDSICDYIQRLSGRANSWIHWVRVVLDAKLLYSREISGQSLDSVSCHVLKMTRIYSSDTLFLVDLN